MSFTCRAACAASLVLACAAPRVGAAEHVIEFFRASFLPQSVTVEVGDTVRFQWVRGEHTVTSGTGAGDPLAGQLFDIELDETRPVFSFAIGVEHIDGVPFFDRLNPGQLGHIQVSRGEVTVRVGVVDNVFIPEDVFIFAGDSVRWEHEFMEDYHTVTSGRSSEPEDDPGALFDEESSCDRPIFVYTFDDAETYPYFCRPHEHMGMKGTIYVQDVFVRGDATGDGSLDISDPVLALNFLFLGRSVRPCLDALDSNDDGQVNIADPIYTLTYLFVGGDELPRPFPLPGGDRTPDELLCMTPPAG